MAINPSTDIILGVLEAADPLKASAAERRLAAFAAVRSSAPAGAFDRRVAGGGTQAVPPVQPRQQVKGKAARVAQDFEAVLLNSFVSEMLPKDSAGFFGQGMAGEAWKSLLSDQISRQIARSGELGIARRLFQSHPIAPSRSASLVGSAPLSSPNEISQSETTS